MSEYPDGKCCKNCEHYKAGTRPTCELPLPWWAEPHDRPAIYGSEGSDCPSFKDFRA